jgi:benzoate/toluate 1,2-dioxygenase beta subunit
MGVERHAAIDRTAIEQVLYREARLLDEGRFDDWLAMFTADAIYWLPAGHADIDPAQHVSIIYDTRADMERRVARLKSGYAHAQDPPSRMHRAISNVEIGGDAADGTLVVSAVMVLFALTRHKQAIHSARCEFHLMRTDGAWKIARKKVVLLRCDEPLDGIPYLV